MNKIIKYITLTLSLILSSLPIWASNPPQPAPQNEDVIIKGENFNIYLQDAQKGDSEAQRRLAICYLYGVGTNKDTKKGIDWLGKSVTQANNEAEYDLAVLYRDGIGVKQNDAEALYWFRKSGRNGNAKSQLNLGMMYEAGKGVQQDYRIALEEYWRAADRGNKDAAYRLACMLRDGKGKPADPKNAYKWFKSVGDYKDAPSQAAALKSKISPTPVKHRKRSK